MRTSVAFFPEDQSLKLAELISSLKGEPEETGPFLVAATKLLEKEKYVDVIALYAKESGTLLEVTDKDLESVYNLLIALVKDAGSDNVAELVKNITTPIVNSPADRATLKLKVLSNLYNNLESTSPARYEVYLAILNVSAKSDELDFVLPTLPSLDLWIVEWGISLNQTRALYQLISEKLFATTLYKLQAYEYLLKFLTTYETADATAIKTVKEQTIRAIKEAIRIPDVLNFEPIFTLKAVQSLKSEQVFKLLTIFVDGNLVQYKKFVTDNPTFNDKQGFLHDDNVRKMRLLTLTSLAANNIQGEVSYETIAEELDITEDEVEMWVIDGIRAGLMEAKMNQLKHTVVISRATQRVFKAQQWQQLDTKLNAWKANLDEMLQVIANAKLLAEIHDQQPAAIQ